METHYQLSFNFGIKLDMKLNSYLSTVTLTELVTLQL